MSTVVSLVDRPVYGFGQVDRILGLTPGTARRWIDGYETAGTSYEPVVRPKSTSETVVSWGEFVEARLLAEYRTAGVPLINMRPVIARLREELGTRYPLASARTWLEPQGRELVGRVQDETRLKRALSLVVRTGQGLLDWSGVARNFEQSVQWLGTGPESEVQAVRPIAAVEQVWADPLRSFGEPVVRGVRTDVIAELIRAGDPPDMIAELYELPRSDVDAAVRYELLRAAAA